ncbi:RNA-directed DNA polymerase, eukaryota, reverse transcriptase zinc-binding domain protein [Tanacetum coccineum]
MISKRFVKPTKIFDNSVTNSSRNKNKQKTASKKNDMFSNAMNDMDDLDEKSDSGNCNEIMENGDKNRDGVGLKEFTQENQVEKRQEDTMKEDVRVEECLDDESGKSESKMVTKDMKIINNKLAFTPTVINEEGSEIVIFDEALVEKGSAQWKLTVCGHFVGYEMNVHELRSEEEAWSTEGISVLTSSLRKPLIMDNMTARRCQFREERLDFARVLVEFDVVKGCKEKIEIQYKDRNNNMKGSKQEKSEEELERDAKKEEDTNRQRMEENKRRINYVNGMENRRFIDRKQNKEGGFYNISVNTNEAKGSKGDVWKKKERNKERYNRHKNKGQEYNERSQNEEVVKNDNKYDALNVLEDDNSELEILKGRMIVDTFMNKKIQLNEINRLKEEEEMNRDIEDVLEVNPGIAKKLNIEEVRGIKRRSLWNELRRIKSITTGCPWILMGDCNVTLKVEEHSAGGSRINGDMQDFVDCGNDIEVEDVNYPGLLFTWIKSHPKPETSIIKKLDRVMVNAKFLRRYGGSHARFHPFLISDHSPVVMHIPNSLEGNKKSFGFSNFIADKQDLEKWEFVSTCEEIGGGFEESSSGAVNDEEKLLAQKAKVKWLSEGDKNTKYFHNVVKSRMNLNRIMRIFDEQGNWFEGDKVPDQFVKHFENFLSNNGKTDQIDSDGLFSKKLTKSKAEFMARDAFDAEVKEAIFRIEDDKAPGHDGFIATFFKKS